MNPRHFIDNHVLSDPFRNPCFFHPGDVRTVLNDGPELKHPYDVKGFSARGYCGLPSMLSVEGDEWNPWLRAQFP